MTKSRLAIILATSLAALSMSASVAAAQLTNNASPVTTVFAPPADKFSVNYFTVDKTAGSITNKDANAGLKEGTRIKLAVADYNQASAQFGSEISAKWNSITGGNHWTKPASAGQPVGIYASLDSIGLKAKGMPASLFNTDKPQQRGLAQFIEIAGAGASDLAKKNPNLFGSPTNIMGAPRSQDLKIVGTGDAISANFAKPAIVNSGNKGSKQVFYVVNLGSDTHDLSARSYANGGSAKKGSLQPISGLTASMSG